jgi:hypothetical protein
MSRRAGAETLQPWEHARDESRRAPQRAKGERSHAGRDYEQDPHGGCGSPIERVIPGV